MLLGETEHHNRLQKIARRFVRLNATNATLLVAVLVPTVYAHVLSSIGSIRTFAQVFMITMISLAFKLAAQEVAKTYTLKRKAGSTRMMVMMAAIPTVLIDTQVRLIILRAQSVTGTLVSTIGMAVLEISSRMLRTLYIRWVFRKPRRVLPIPPTDNLPPTTTTTRIRSVGRQLTKEASEFTVWRERLYHYHATELTADVYAEYLAIGCSSGVMIIFGSHPKFDLGIGSSEAAPSAIKLQLMVQVAVEARVDLASCFLEIAAGVKFAFPRSERGLDLVVFVTLAIVNLNLSVIFNMKKT